MATSYSHKTTPLPARRYGHLARLDRINGSYSPLYRTSASTTEMRSMTRYEYVYARLERDE